MQGLNRTTYAGSPKITSPILGALLAPHLGRVNNQHLGPGMAGQVHTRPGARIHNAFGHIGQHTP